MSVYNEADKASFPGLNRATRRAGIRRKRKTDPLQAAHERLVQCENTYSRIVAGNQPLTRLIYQADLNIFDRLLSWRQYSQALSQFPFSEPEEQSILSKRDYYNLPVQGVSLSDVEKIDHPLEEDDVKKISRIFKPKTYLRLFRKKSTLEELMIRDSIAIIATLPFAQKNIQVPPELKDLQKRATEYFDFGFPYLKNLFPDPDLETGYLFYMSVNSFDTFDHLFAYMPARLGILPQTAYEMYLAKANIGLSSDGWRNLNRYGRVEIKMTDAFPKGTLSSDLINPSIVHNINRDSANKLSDQLLIPRVDPRVADEAVDQFAGFRKILRSEVLGSRDGVVVLPFENSGMFDRIAITCHTAKAAENYRDTFIVAVRPKGVGKDVILEVGKNSSIYGIPYEVLKSNPHAEMVLRKKLLGEIAEYCQSQYPAKKSSPEVGYRPVLLTPSELRPIIPVSELSLPSDKVKTRGQSHEAQVKKTEETTEKATYVNFSVADIERLLGKVKDKTILTRIITTLSRFESTGKGIYELTSAKTKGAELFGLKCGDYRIILSKEGSQFGVEDILNRSGYNNKELDRLIERFIQSKM